ncbi:hypothetical protein NicSoilB4_08870 [Arthrobacter sp. NicSoilB4]|nr:hypothetical protein NicSoilB4_08870 [Arthrobacter sp. NicSoilB4]
MPPRAVWSRSSSPVLTGWLLAAVLSTGALAGCAPAPELDRGAARELQSKVLAVTEAAAANDPAASLKQLDELVLKLDEAAARGEVSFKRHQSIRKSVDSVRGDLTARQAEAEAARVAAAEAARVAAEKEAAAQAAAAAAAAPPAPVPPAESGKGKGKGKG